MGGRGWVPGGSRMLVKILNGGGVVSGRKFPAEREEESGGALGLRSPKEGWGGVEAHWALLL